MQAPLMARPMHMREDEAKTFLPKPSIISPLADFRIPPIAADLEPPL